MDEAVIEEIAKAFGSEVFTETVVEQALASVIVAKCTPEFKLVTVAVVAPLSHK